MTNEFSSIVSRLLGLENKHNATMALVRSLQVQMATVAQQAGQLANAQGFNGGWGSGSGAVWPGYTTGTVSAATDFTHPGSGSVTLQKLNDSGVLEDLRSVTAYSKSSEAVASGVNIYVGRDLAGAYWLLTKDCD